MSEEAETVGAPTSTTPTGEEDLAASRPEPTEEASDIQLEPTQDEMERERLTVKAEQLQDEIQELRKQLYEKEAELAEVKEQLGITPFVEFKQSVAHGFKVVGDKLKEVQETETYRKIDETLSGWKHKVEETETYQKTTSALSEGGKKASGAISSAGTRIKENETVKSIGERTSSGLKRAGTAIKDTSSALKDRVMHSFDYGTEGGPPSGEGETVVPDEPPKKE